MKFIALIIIGLTIIALVLTKAVEKYNKEKQKRESKWPPDFRTTDN